MNSGLVINRVGRFGSHCIGSSGYCKVINGTKVVFSHSGLRSTGIDVFGTYM